MNAPMLCNSQKCRNELRHDAAITTCLHIFCVDCFTRSNPPNGQWQVCPACSTLLVNQDDVIIGNLNPPENYIRRVLSGLSPNLIMECAGTALDFWAYQKNQEIIYQNHVVNNLKEKYNMLSTELDRIISSSKSDASKMRSKLESMTVDQDALRRKNEELRDAYEDKSRKQLRTQEMYDKLKRQSILEHNQNAAPDAVEHHIEASVRGYRFDDRFGTQAQRIHQPIFGGNQTSNGVRKDGEGLGYSTRAISDTNNAWSGNQGVTQNDPMATPSSHRQRLNSINIPNTSHGYAGNAFPGTPSIQRLAPRQLSTGVSTPNSPRINNNSGFGLSARARVSNPNVSAQGFYQPTGAQPSARVTHRSVSADSLGSRFPTFGANVGVNNFP